MDFNIRGESIVGLLLTVGLLTFTYFIFQKPKESSLYDRLGGEPAIDAAVNLFYEKVLTDAKVKDFFATVDMVRQKKMQKEFLSSAFGSSTEYKGRFSLIKQLLIILECTFFLHRSMSLIVQVRSMSSAHRILVEKKGLNDEHVDVICRLLAETLADLG